MRLCLTLPTMGELEDTSLDYVVEAGQGVEAPLLAGVDGVLVAQPAVHRPGVGLEGRRVGVVLADWAEDRHHRPPGS